MATMQQQSDTRVHSASGLDNCAALREIVPAAPWSVAELEVLPGYRLWVKFMDGTDGTVDMSALVHSNKAGVFARLQDAGQFAAAFISYGAVAWPETAGQPAIDLAPDAMHRAILQNGEWIL